MTFAVLEKGKTMRLVDADALEKDLAKRWDVNDDTDFANKEVWRALRESPTIDAEPVVRCKDCKWWDECDELDENGYCHHGERGR